MDAPIQFGKYTLIRKIATGGMAEIYLAREPGPDGYERFVVIKRILPHLTENQEFVRMFIDEMSIAAILNHPNIIQISDLGDVDDRYFIAMEYLEGRDLRRIMHKVASRKESLPLGFVLCTMARVCEGLHHAHGRKGHDGAPLKIIHRDVSPQNIMVSVQGTVKVLDFGIAKAESQVHETRSGILKGKYSYMSPEQAGGQPLDHRSDIFPIGTMLHELTTGRRLFKDDNELAILKMISEAQVPRPSMQDAAYPPDLERIVLKALARSPDDRYQTCLELQTDIEEFILRRRLLLTPAAMGEFVANLFADERDEMEPESIAHGPLDEKVVSFLDPIAEEDGTNPSASSAARRALDAGSDASRTGSLRVLIQHARRRPGLTVGIASAIVSAIVVSILLIVLGSGRTTNNGPSTAGDDPGAITSVGAPRGDTVSLGTLAVESTPAGARVYLDGVLQEQRTPMTIGAVITGEAHFVVAEMDGATAQARRVVLEIDGDFETLHFDFRATGQPARVAFVDLPEGATVVIDGQARSRDNYSVQPGVPHTVVVTVHGEEILREEVLPSESDVIRLRFLQTPVGLEPSRGKTSGPRPQAAGVLALNSTPPTTVYLDRRSLGPTPIRTEVDAGTYNLRLVNRSLLIDYPLRLTVRAGQTLDRSVEIPQGQLSVSVRPFAEVSINGVPLGRTPLRRALYAGTYSVVLTNMGLDRQERHVVTIRGGSDERIRVDWR